MRTWRSSLNDDPHAPRRSFDNSNGSVKVRRIEVCHFFRGNIFQLSFGDFAHLIFMRDPRAFDQTGCFFEQIGCGRRASDERERPVFVNRDHDRNDAVSVLLSPGVELFTELHDIHAVLTQGRSDRWSRIRLAGRNL